MYIECTNQINDEIVAIFSYLYLNMKFTQNIIIEGREKTIKL